MSRNSNRISFNSWPTLSSSSFISVNIIYEKISLNLLSSINQSIVILAVTYGKDE